jgi:acyl-CoA thioesterase
VPKGSHKLMKQFDQETLLQPLGNGRYGGQLYPSFNIGSNPNGGYLMALGASALRQLHPNHPDPLSITAHYLRPGVGDAPCEVATSLLRSGKTVSTARATLLQEGKERIEILAAFGDLANTTDVPLHIDAPSIPSPEECIGRSGEAQGVSLGILDRLEIRLNPDEARPGALGKGQISGWVRFRDGRPPDAMAALLFSDALPPAIFGLLGLVGWVPTIELTVHVRRKPAPGWIQAQFKTHDMADSRMIEDGLLWDSQGSLIAQSRQLALLLKKP